MHTLREKYGIKSHCHCTNKQNIQVDDFPTMNGVSQVSINLIIQIKCIVKLTLIFEIQFILGDRSP